MYKCINFKKFVIPLGETKSEHKLEPDSNSETNLRLERDYLLFILCEQQFKCANLGEF